MNEGANDKSPEEQSQMQPVGPPARVCQVKMTLAVQFFDVRGRVRHMQNFEVLLCEADFDQTLADIAGNVAAQAAMGGGQAPGR